MCLSMMEDLLPLNIPSNLPNNDIGHMEECPLALQGYPKYESPPCSLECNTIRSVIKILRKEIDSCGD